ncbi:MAG: alcohol dehydrogenase [Elusimicrobia bacterium RIFOXYA2_FULL_39_19]|nr:MAG: alcohol dehydrogenase [Elusimicrobia bacterium RIFOXYA2_FULL_39_19]
MRVAMWYNNSDVRVQEMPVPEISPKEVLVKVIASGICGSDVLEWYRIKKAPLVLGHEITGEIVKTGTEVKKYKVGDRVFVSHHVPCNICLYCLNGEHTACETLQKTNFYPGGFAEYLRVPEINVDRGIEVLPEDMSFDDGVFIEPLACIVRGQRTAGFKPGKTLLVLGSGMAGLLHIALARVIGMGKIIATDISEYRLNAAKEMGADVSINSKDNVLEAVLKANDGRKADYIIVSTGAPIAFAQAFECIDKGGTILFFAPNSKGEPVALPINDHWRNGIKMLFSYGGAPNDIQSAITYIRSKKMPLNKMITHKLPMAEIGLGFKLTAEAKDSIKVIIEPNK